MRFNGGPTIAERLLAWLLARHPYRDAILGDLHEGAHDEAHESKIEATRRYRREVRRSFLALLPSAAVRERYALAGAAFGVAVYALSVKASSVLAVLITERISPADVLLRWCGYLVVIVAAGLFAGALLGRMHKLPIATTLLFVAMAIGAGMHHVLVSRSSELAFRSTKVTVFIVASLAGMAWGISRRRRNYSVRT